MIRLRMCALILTMTIAVSCRTAGSLPAPPPRPPLSLTSDTADLHAEPGGVPAKTVTFNIPSFDFKLLRPEFLQHLRETSPVIDGTPPTYGKSRNNPAIIMSTGTFALMDKTSILNRRWTASPFSSHELDVVGSRFRSYIESNAYLRGIDPDSLQVQLPPPVVIHEIPADMTIRQQSPPRLTCVAHASMAAMEIRSDVPNDLSEQYAHHVFLQNLTKPGNCCDDSGVFVLDAAHDLEKTGVPVESDFPYTSDLPACKGRSGFPCLDDNGHDATLPVIAPRYRVTGVGEIPEGTEGATIGNVGYLESILDAGFDIVIEVGIAWLNDKQPDSKGPDNIIPVLLVADQNNDPLKPAGYHAMLLTGYDRNRHFFIARNSMGSAWGLHNGEAWLSYNYVTTYAVAGFIITGVEKELQTAEPLPPGPTGAALAAHLPVGLKEPPPITAPPVVGPTTEPSLPAPHLSAGSPDVPHAGNHPRGGAARHHRSRRHTRSRSLRHRIIEKM